MFYRKKIILVVSLFSLIFSTGCSNTAQETNAEMESDVINEEDYLRFAENSLDAYKIACFAVKNGEWIFAAQKWSEGDTLSEQEGKLVARGLTEAMNIRLEKGQNAKWNGESAEETIKSACARISNQ